MFGWARVVLGRPLAYRRFTLAAFLTFLTGFTALTVFHFARALALSARSRSAALSIRRCSAA